MAASYKKVLEKMRSLYMENDRPWVIGFSGGKDSTAVLQLVFLLFRKMPYEQRRKMVHVVANDTLVEIPQVASMVAESVTRINEAATRLKFPITAIQTTPDPEDTFFVNLIGRGYPSPTSRFRWCTERMKINPTSDYIRRLVTERGEVIVFLVLNENLVKCAFYAAF